MKPRWLGLLALLAVVLVGFVRLGSWQYDVARDSARDEALARAAALTREGVQDVLDPHTPFPGDASTRPISALGRYDADGEVLVGPRRLDDEQGRWVITPFVVESTGAVLPVLRGFSPDGAAAVPPPPPGSLLIEGALAPGESPSEDLATDPTQLGSVDLALLVNVWGADLYNAFVFLTAERPAPTPGDAPGSGGDPSAAATVDAIPAAATLPRVPPPTTVGEGLNWRNAAYALQWWLIAAFAVWMWWKMVRTDHERTRTDRDQ